MSGSKMGPWLNMGKQMLEYGEGGRMKSDIGDGGMSQILPTKPGDIYHVDLKVKGRGKVKVVAAAVAKEIEATPELTTQSIPFKASAYSSPIELKNAGAPTSGLFVIDVDIK